jgi:signal transduction histidine kinase
MAIFAIVQEAVNNALKHAMADNIYVTLDLKKDLLSVTILDDGQGFDLNTISNNYEDRGSYGMINIKERAAVADGDLTMKSAPGAGTEIQVNIPLTPDLLAAD